MIYFDNNAISKPSKQVLNTVINVLTEHWYNPNSIYENGLESRKLWNNAKKVIADEINCDAEDLTICSCGSEAITTAISGYIKANYNNCFITDETQHSSVLDNPYAKPLIHIDNNGFYIMEDIKNIYDKLVVLSIASSEIGVIQNITEITKILHNNRNTVFCDFTAGFGKIKLNVKDLGVDMLVATSQKIHGIMGCAFLYKNKKTVINKLIFGHGIENMRGGTPNLAALCAFSEAVKEFNWDDVKEIRQMRDYFIYQLLEIKGVKLNGSAEKRLCNNINIRINGLSIDNQQLLALLDLQGYCCSSSSACNSGLRNPSKTLLALGLTEKEANSSIRITLSKENTYEEINKFVVDLNNIVKQFS